MKNDADFVLEGVLRRVSVKDTNGDDFMHLVLRFDDAVSTEDAHRALRIGQAFSEKECILHITSQKGRKVKTLGWISEVRAKSDKDKDTLISWTVNASIELDGLRHALEMYLPLRKNYMVIAGRVRLSQHSIVGMQSGDPHDAFAQEVTEAMQAHGIPVQDGDEVPA